MNLSWRRGFGDDPPLVFAAAGSTRTPKRQWRLAYPAVLPDTVAVTQIKKSLTVVMPAPKIDLPAVGPLKPCFSEPPRPGMEDVGTSFACATLAGRWAFWDKQFSMHQRNLGQFEKMAHILSWSDVSELPVADSQVPNMPRPWVPCLVSELTQNHTRQWGERSSSLFTQLLASINSEFRVREFLLTGSGAYVATWFARQPSIEKSLVPGQCMQVLGLLGDLDLLYTGANLDSGEHQKVRSLVASWLVKCGQPITEWETRIQLHSVRQWGGGMHMLQCVIPAASIFLTAAGTIDPWGVNFNPLDAGALEFFAPPKEAWEWNPQFRGRTSGLAHAIVIWLNLNLIGAHLQQLFPQTDRQLRWCLPKVFENLVPDPISAILRSQQRTTQPLPDSESLTQEQLQSLFGHMTSITRTDRLSARLEHTAQLLKNETGDFWHSANRVHQWLTQTWANFINMYLRRS